MPLRVTLRYPAILCALLLVGFVLAVPARAQQDKRAQAGMKFVGLSVDARGAALGDAMTSLEGSSAMLFYNPAGIARQTSFIDVTAGQVGWIADINYNQATIGFAPKGGRYGVFGVSVMAVDYGDMEGTIIDESLDRAYRDTGTFSANGIAVGVAYARALTDRFSAGGHVKFVEQDLGSGITPRVFRNLLNENGFPIPRDSDGDGIPDTDADGAPIYVQESVLLEDDFTESVIAYDFGVLYKTGFESLNFAFSARNFSSEVTYLDEGFQLPLALNIGLSMNVVDLTQLNPSMHKLMVTVDAAKPRDFAEQVRVGTEYLFMNTLALRFGYAYPSDEQTFSLGAGIQQAVRGFGFGADYAYTEFGVFGSVHRLSFRLAL